MQGFNMGRYYPPDSSSSDPPSFNKAHPLGARARKLRSQGIMTVRFEMPFAIWCSHCTKPTIIGQGVRFNAEKKKVGNYYTTPIWSFRMKHVVCGGPIEIRTDPKAGEYIVTEGAKRRDYGDDKFEGEGGVLNDEERARRREDAMAGLEGRKEEAAIQLEGGKRVEEFLEDRDKWWADPYEANRAVRKGFRRERKERVRENIKAEGIKDRLGLDVDLAPENEEDRLRAGIVDFGRRRAEGAIVAANKPLFKAAVPVTKKASARDTTASKSCRLQLDRKQRLAQELRDSSRASLDPWNTNSATATIQKHKIMSKLRAKHSPAVLPQPEPKQQQNVAPTAATVSLVAYDSD